MAAVNNVVADTDSGGEKRTYSSPLQAEENKRANMATSPNSDTSFNEFMATIPSPPPSGQNPQTHVQAQPQNVTNQYPVVGPYGTLTSQPLANYQYPQQGIYHAPGGAQSHWPQGYYHHPQMQQQQGLLHPAMGPRFPPPGVTTPATPQPGQYPPPGASSVPRMPIATSTATVSVINAIAPEETITAPTDTKVTTENFANLLAAAFQTQQLKESLGDIIQDKLEKMTENHEHRLRELESKNMALEMDNVALMRRLETAEADINNLEQYSRRNSLRISNQWPETENENTDTLILNMAEQQLGVELTPSDIDRSHRVGPPSAPKPRPVLVKFTSYRAHEKVYRARTKLKNSDTRIFINEDLTKFRAQLASKCRMLSKENKISDTWTYDGRIFIKTSAGPLSQ